MACQEMEMYSRKRAGKRKKGKPKEEGERAGEIRGRDGPGKVGIEFEQVLPKQQH